MSSSAPERQVQKVKPDTQPNTQPKSRPKNRLTEQHKTGSSKSYFKKSAPPLHLETHGSRTQAALVFCLHLLALSALFGACAHLLHYLVNELYPQQLVGSSSLGNDHNTSTISASGSLHTFSFVWIPVNDKNILREAQSPGVFKVVSSAIMVVLTLIALTVAILRSALNAHNDACKQMLIRWNPDGTLSVQTPATVDNLPLAADRQYVCRLHPGSYNSHWLVILRCSLVDGFANPPGNTQSSKRFCILLARDSLAQESFRHLRLWMRLVAPGQLSQQNSSAV